MEGELGSGARIAIALIVIGVIISVIFVILGFTRGTTNQGISTVQTSMDTMSLAQFDDFDQKIQSGTQVISAVKLFEGRPVGLVVINKPLSGTALTRHNYGAILTGADPETSGGVTVGYTLADTDIPKTSGNSYYTGTINMTSGLKINTNYLPLTQAASQTFVRPTAKFLSELIKDNTGTIIGICFTQM